MFCVTRENILEYFCALSDSTIDMNFSASVTHYSEAFPSDFEFQAGGTDSELYSLLKSASSSSSSLLAFLYTLINRLLGPSYAGDRTGHSNFPWEGLHSST